LGAGDALEGVTDSTPGSDQWPSRTMNRFILPLELTHLAAAVEQRAFIEADW